MSEPFGRPRVHLRRTGSTNDRARAAALAGAPEGTVVTAREQAAGRGRQGRSWVAPPGRALTASVVLRPLDERLTLAPLATALAVAAACERLAGVPAAIKWPNDIWIDGRKVSGILLEARQSEGWAVAGIGVNVDLELSDLPAELRGSATSLGLAARVKVGVEDALAAVLSELGSEIVALREEGPEQLLRRYRERDALAGREVSWRESGAARQGRAAGIDERGSLRVEVSGGGLVALEAGEVHLVGAAPV